MRRDVGAILFVAALAAACSGGSETPTSPSNPASAGSLGAGVSSQTGNNSAEVKGTVDALPPATAAGTFTTAGKTIVMNSSTVFVSGTTAKSFADLKLGETVEVRGTASGNTITASRVEIEVENEAEAEPEPEPHDPNPPAPNPPAPNPPAPAPPDNDEREVEVKGTLGPIGGTCPSISSSVGTTRFTTNGSTRFDDVACAALTAGNRVEVKGTRNADGSISAARVKKD